VKPEAGSSFNACTAALIAGILNSYHPPNNNFTEGGKASSSGHVPSTV
jgi:hypothetical protein